MSRAIIAALVVLVVLCLRVNAEHSNDPSDIAADCAKFGCNTDWVFSVSLKLPWRRW